MPTKRNQVYGLIILDLGGKANVRLFASKTLLINAMADMAESREWSPMPALFIHDGTETLFVPDDWNGQELTLITEDRNWLFTIKPITIER